MRPAPRTPFAGTLVSACAVLGLLAAACGSDDARTTEATAGTTGVGTASSPALSGPVVVFAAASLAAAYTEIGDAFQTEHPDVDITFSFDSSSNLVAQIGEGAPADVFASADQPSMARLADAGGNAGEPIVFATNSMQIIVEAGNPQGIAAVADLADPDIVYITCAPEVPVGAYGAQVLADAGVAVTPASFEENVKGIVTKVTGGEADAGIVYATDVIAAGLAAEGVAIPADVNVVATYPVVVTTAAVNAEGARSFVDFVVGAQGQAILASHGFGAP